MKFKKIVLNNFRQYKGINEIIFSTDDTRNITVVYGRITCGKTTLLQAFNWTLYGQLNLQNKDRILNFEVEESLIDVGQSAEVYVEIYIDNNGKEYRFKRVANFVLNSNGRLESRGGYTAVDVNENDVWKPIGDFDEEVKKILPYHLSTYFFFDGERMNVISEEQRKGSEEVAQSVKSILGLEHYSTAIKHLSKGSKSVISELTRKLNTDANDKLNVLKQNIEMYDNEIQTKTNKINSYNEEIEKLDIMKKAKEKLILENRETYSKQKEKERKKAELKKLEDKKQKLFDNYYSYFGTYYLDLFYYGLFKKIRNISELLNNKEEGIPDTHSKAIRYIINRGYCICGEKFSQDENDAHYKCLIEEMKKLPPESLGTSIYNFKKEIIQNINDSKANNFKEEIISKYSDLIDITEEQNRLNDEIESISKDIASDVDVGSLELEVNEIDNNIREYTKKVIKLESDIEILKNDKEADKKEILRLSQFDTRNMIIGKQLAMAERIVSILSTAYAQKEEELINNLEIEINKYLSKIYEGKRIMKITKDYKFQLKYVDDSSEASSIESEGLGTVKAISFMCGLLEVAKSHYLPEVSDETMYPLVFDAPLSKIDSVHRRNVMSSLPEIASQVILFTREEKDLDDITEETRKKIGREYIINKITEKCSHLEPKKEGV